MFPGFENTVDWWANSVLVAVAFLWAWHSMRFEEHCVLETRGLDPWCVTHDEEWPCSHFVVRVG